MSHIELAQKCTLLLQLGLDGHDLQLVHTAEAGVNRPGQRREILPGVNAVAPVIQAEGAVHFSQIIIKAFFRCLINSICTFSEQAVVIFCFVIDLKTDRRRVSGHLPLIAGR